MWWVEGEGGGEGGSGDLLGVPVDDGWLGWWWMGEAGTARQEARLDDGCGYGWCVSWYGGTC